MYWLPAKRDAVIDMWLWIPPQKLLRAIDSTTCRPQMRLLTSTCLENRVKDFRSFHNSAKLNVIKARWNINFHVPLDHEDGAMSNEEIHLRSEDQFTLRLPNQRYLYPDEMRFLSCRIFSFLFFFFFNLVFSNFREEFDRVKAWTSWLKGEI